MLKINNYHVKVLFKLFKIQLPLITVLQNKIYNYHTKQITRSNTMYRLI